MQTLAVWCTCSFAYYNSSIPNRRTTIANSAKHIAVMAMQAIKVGQKPKRGKNAGKARNMGKVGMTYQNVYHA